MSSAFFKSAFKAGLIVGLLDITAACLNAYIAKGVSPARVCRFVASGVFGKDALAGGDGMAMMGLFFHFTIATGWTFLFFALYRRLNFYSMNKFLVGPLYGIFVWLMMNLVVLPLSNVGPLPYRLIPTLIMIGIHMFVIGLSISLLANQYLYKEDFKKVAA